jgi:AmmeMemoRadiSam system protein A
VGYATIAFYGENNMSQHASSQLTPEQGQTLVELARLAIAEELNIEPGSVSSTGMRSRLDDPVFDQQRGTFVTLHIQEQLRGCIGSLVESEPLRTSVRKNAVNAAFRDPRFPPLGQNEFPEVTIEVSILTEPQPLEYSGPEELVNRLRPNIDGVILSKGPARSTFLPQVWEQLSKPEDFLSHLCLKAGLSADAWKKEHPEIQTYQAQYFAEEK